MYSTVWFKKLCKEVVSLEYEEHIGWSLEVDNNQLRGSLKLILLQHMRRCYRTQHWPFYGHLTFEANWKSEKAQYVGISWADWKKKKSFWNVIFSYSMQQQWTISQLDSDMQWKLDFINCWTGKKVQITSQSQTYTKKIVMVTMWWSAVHLIHYGFLNPGKTITSEKYAQQMYETHQKLQHL